MSDQKSGAADPHASHQHGERQHPGAHQHHGEQDAHTAPDAHTEHGALDAQAAPDTHAEHGAHAEHAAPADNAGHEGHNHAPAAVAAGAVAVGASGRAATSAHAHGSDHAAGHDGAHVDHAGHELVFRNRFWVSLLLTIPVLLYSHMIQEWFGFQPPAFPGSEWVAPIFATAIFIYGGVPFYRMAWPEVQNRKPGMMVLISLAITVAYMYSVATIWIDPTQGFFWEMALLIDVMLLGHWLEMRSIRQASGALNELAKLLPDEAERILPDGSVETVSIDRLAVGDVLLVRPGARIPADGVIVDGASGVNESMITGESRAVDKEIDDPVIAGSLNGDGSLRIRVTTVGEGTVLAGIMRLVQDAQASKSPAQLLADKVAGWLFYIALGVAVLTAIVWTVATGFSLDTVERVVTVLVIACPHALGLAIPLVVAISTSLAAKNGILIRNRPALEETRLLNTVLFDKTGTLTRGEFGVVGMATIPGISETEALSLAAAVEGDSEHLIARAIRSSAQERGVEIPQSSDFGAIQGRGARAEVDGKEYYAGGPRMLEMLQQTPPDALRAFIADSEARGQSVIYLIGDAGVIGVFALADVVRPESAKAVNLLQEMDVEVAMLTGDSRAVAESVANELQIKRFFAEVLPENKDTAVGELQAKGAKVGMVGDGVNDAPALTRANVGIAIGSGTDVAVESADIVLVKSNPIGVVNAIHVSKATHRKMVQNLWWAAGYNIVALPLAAGVLAPWGIELSPAVGAIFMSLSTIIVAINAQTLRGLKLAQ